MESISSNLTILLRQLCEELSSAPGLFLFSNVFEISLSFHFFGASLFMFMNIINDYFRDFVYKRGLVYFIKLCTI